VIESARAISAFSGHAEHLILDWSSDTPLSSDELPRDPRIRIVRVEGERSWWLSRAYNLAFQLARGHVIAKVDADIVLGPAWFAQLEQTTACFRTASGFYGQYYSYTGPSRGVFVITKDHLKLTGGFNEYIKGWGSDDVDLYIRIYQAGICIQRMSPNDVWPIDHPHIQSYAVADGGRESRVFARKRANNALNYEIGRTCNWGPDTPNTEYEADHHGTYRVTRLPRRITLSPEQARRMEQIAVTTYLSAMGQRRWHYLNRALPTLTKRALRRDLAGLFDNPLIDFTGGRS
jgi:glycosyltransferase involved in cell wall biosynthesis